MATLECGLYRYLRKFQLSWGVAVLQEKHVWFGCSFVSVFCISPGYYTAKGFAASYHPFRVERRKSHGQQCTDQSKGSAYNPRGSGVQQHRHQ